MGDPTLVGLVVVVHGSDDDERDRDEDAERDPGVADLREAGLDDVIQDVIRRNKMRVTPSVVIQRELKA